MGDIYCFGILATWALCGTAWLYALIACLIIYARAFVNDEEIKGPPLWFIPDMSKSCRYIEHSGGDTAMALALGAIIGFVGGLVWIVIWPVIVVAGCLLGARKFVRFGKKLDNHRHAEDGSVEE